MIQAIERFCRVIHDMEQPLGPGFFHEKHEQWAGGWDFFEGGVVEVVTSLEIKPGCQWQANENICGRELRQVVDKCNTDGENRKQGGWMENNCAKWRVDPQRVT